MTYLTPEEVAHAELGRSHYGCGNTQCLSCYPLQYACEWCLTDFPAPIRNGAVVECEHCGWLNNQETP